MKSLQENLDQNDIPEQYQYYSNNGEGSAQLTAVPLFEVLYLY